MMAAPSPRSKRLTLADGSLYIGTFSKMLMPGLRVDFLSFEFSVIDHR